MMLPPPASFFGFNCLALNVKGPGIGPDPRVCGGQKPPAGMGRISNFAPLGGSTVEVKVPPGAARTVQLLGAMTGGLGCPTFESLVTFNGPSGITTYFLGEKTVDVFGDVSLTLRAQYNPASPMPMYNDCGDSNVVPTLPGLLAWYSAEDMAMLPANTAVAGWTDRSPFGHNATQTTGGLEPLTAPASLNGHAAVSFNGANQYLTAATDASWDSPTASFTIALVGQFNAMGAIQPWVTLYYTTPAAMTFGLQISGGNLLTGIAFNNTVTSMSAVGTGSFAGSSHVFLYVWKASGSVELYVDGAPDGPATPFTNMASFGGANTIYIGGNGGTYTSGLIAELAMYNQGQSDPDRQRLECSLGMKYGIPISHACP